VKALCSRRHFHTGGRRGEPDTSARWADPLDQGLRRIHRHCPRSRFWSHTHRTSTSPPGADRRCAFAGGRSSATAAARWRRKLSFAAGGFPNPQWAVPTHSRRSRRRGSTAGIGVDQSPGATTAGRHLGHSGQTTASSERQVSRGQRTLGPTWHRTSGPNRAIANCRPTADGGAVSGSTAGKRGAPVAQQGNFPALPPTANGWLQATSALLQVTHFHGEMECIWREIVRQQPAPKLDLLGDFPP
jgi:hypothetical protein